MWPECLMRGRFEAIYIRCSVVGVKFGIMRFWFIDLQIRFLPLMYD
jgi:hypothetical protein